MSFNKPTDRRFNLMNWLCYHWIKNHEPKRWQKFRRMAEIEIPLQKGGRYKNRDAQGKERTNAKSASA